MAPRCGSDAVAGSARFRRRKRSCGLRYALFLMTGQVRLFQVRMACSLRSPRPPRGSLWAPSQPHQDLPDVTLMVANPEFLLDQVCHPWAGPQRSLVAQRLRPSQQQPFQSLALRDAEPCLSSGASSLPQAFLAPLSILCHPVWRATFTRRATSDWFRPWSSRRMAWKRRFSSASKSRRTLEAICGRERARTGSRFSGK